MPVKRLLYTVPGEQVDDLLPTVPAVVLAPSLARAVPESVCVTGASGFVAQEMVAQLLEGGFDVHGTVRSLAKTEIVQPLLDTAKV